MNTSTDKNGNTYITSYTTSRRSSSKTRLIKIQCFNCSSTYRCSRTTMETAQVPFKEQQCQFCGIRGYLMFDGFHTQLYGRDQAHLNILKKESKH